MRCMNAGSNSMQTPSGRNSDRKPWLQTERPNLKIVATPGRHVRKNCYICTMITNIEPYSQLVASGLKLPPDRVRATLKLLVGGATIPFISRYRKETTGGMDEVKIGDIQACYQKLVEIARRKETILNTLSEQGNLNDELRKKIDGCWDATALEDLYLPYKPKRKTKAEAARLKGLAPLADLLMEGREKNVEACARRFLTDEIDDEQQALQGARDIIAERVSENARARQLVRNVFRHEAVITAKVIKGKDTEEASAKYRDYFSFSEPLKRCTSHRLLALRRGEAEGVLRVGIAPADDEGCTTNLKHLFVKSEGGCAAEIRKAVEDAYKRLLKPSIETEYANLSAEKAGEEAIRVFASNLRQLLLAPPLGQKRVMGIDPGFRTGCKVVCLDAQGTLLHNETIFPHPPRSEYRQAANALQRLVEQYGIEAIACGNGTAGRETEELLSALTFSHPVAIFAVSEDGASVYSASKAAREEFPEYDVTVRGAVSIARRLMDPLAELVKIDPKSIGVGQYQHDVDQSKLKEALDHTVESCVNAVGVNVNTASKHLLTYISGLGPALAQNIVDYRTANGPFRSRKELLDVPRMGAKAFEQCAGFLRIPDGKNPLDNSAVHPESYKVVEQMADDLHCTVAGLMADKSLRARIRPERYVGGNIGLPTLKDILQELDKPGRDPRPELKPFAFEAGLHSLDDLHEGMELPGIVTNITNFGCFVDIGIKTKGLIHISQLSDRYISDPATVVKLHAHVRVKVIGIDRSRSRVQLSMKDVIQPEQ